MSGLTDEQLAVIEKVRKLLALANNNPSEEEASVASAKAMQILAAFNLDMAVVEQGGKSSKRSDQFLAGGLYVWQRELWLAVAELNFCQYWYVPGQTRGSKYEHRLLGRKENVVGTQLMATYIQNAIERLAREKAGQGSRYFVREMIAYREGMADRLCSRLRQLRRDQEKAEADRRSNAPPSDGKSLILADVREAEEAANYDYLNGEGAWARKKAREAEGRRILDEMVRKRREWEAANPEKAAAERKAREAEWRKEQSKSKARYRERAPTDRERRMSSQDYHEGWDKGGSINLDRQIDKSKTGQIK